MVLWDWKHPHHHHHHHHPCTHAPRHAPCNHAPCTMPCTTHAPTHARPSLPVVPEPILTPPNMYPSGLHDTAAHGMMFFGHWRAHHATYFKITSSTSTIVRFRFDFKLNLFSNMQYINEIKCWTSTNDFLFLLINFHDLYFCKDNTYFTKAINIKHETFVLFYQ